MGLRSVRLLRDRPADGAALAAEISAGIYRCVGCGGSSGGHCGEASWTNVK